MKKIIILVILLISIVFGIKKISNNEIIIPKEAIRFRIIPNSNTKKDQFIKKRVKDETEKELVKIIKKPQNIDMVRKDIKNNIKTINNVVKNTLDTENYKLDYKINYGLNKFPSKKYKGIVYKEGEYESLVITLGEGKGDNWWCVLFPPLCLLEAEESDEVEYKCFVKELIEKFF